jgi:hypothetical protein
MQFITKDEFLHSPGRQPYFRNRWGFTSRVITRIKAMGEVGRVLELGPGPTGKPIIVGADTMDFIPEFNPVILHDACITPWPIADKSYDLFIAMQVFEHLEGRQREAFAEVRRISRRALLTLPFRCKSRLHAIDKNTYLTWLGRCAEMELVDSGSCPKYMLYFNFEP